MKIFLCMAILWYRWAKRAVIFMLFYLPTWCVEGSLPGLSAAPFPCAGEQRTGRFARGDGLLAKPPGAFDPVGRVASPVFCSWECKSLTVDLQFFCDLWTRADPWKEWGKYGWKVASGYPDLAGPNLKSKTARFGSQPFLAWV